MLDLVNLLTNVMWVVYAIAFPLALVMILGYLASGSYGASVTSYDYYGVSLMIYAIFNVATYSANSFMEERIKSPNLRIVHSPLSPFAIHFSKVLASFLFCLVSYSIVTLFLWLVMDVNYGGSYFVYLYLIMSLAIFFFAALGVMVCCLLKSESLTNSILSFLLSVLAVLGGVFFPIDSLGTVAAFISWLSPAKWILTCCFQIIYDHNLKLFIPTCGVLIVLSIVAVSLSSRLFKVEDYV